MNNKMKDIYQGKNMIYESLRLTEAEGKKPAADGITELTTVLNNFFDILMVSKMENAKTVRGFQEIKNKILGTTNFGAFKQYVISVVQALGAMDLQQKDVYQKNIQYMADSLNKLDGIFSDVKQYDAFKKSVISKLLENFEADLKERDKQMKKTNPDIYNKAIKSGDIVKEDKKTGEESDVAEGEFRGKVFNRSKESLDAATAFMGMIDRDKIDPLFKSNADVKRYADIAAGLYKKAQDLQMLDRKGLTKIETSSGEFKRNDYLLKQDSLINEIIRQKKEYLRIKEALLKGTGLTIPTFIDPIKPPSETKPTEKPKEDKKPVSACTFPLSLNSKCKEVGILQSKLMEIIPSVKSYLSKKGGADNVYGKATASASNIVFAYVTGKKDQELTGPLTKEMYDGILTLTKDDVDIDIPLKDNRNSEMSIEDKIQEREEIQKSPVLSFEDFYTIIEESQEFTKFDNRLVEDSVEALYKRKLKDSCIKASLESGKIEDCVTAGATGTGATGTGATGTGETGAGATGAPKKWKGLKPVRDNIYVISYDESAASVMGKIAIGTAAGVATVLTGGAALGLFAPAAIGGAAAVGSAAAGTAVAGSLLATGAGMTALGSLLGGAAIAATPVVIGAGAVGGAGAASLMSGRTNVAVTVTNGFISRGAIIRMVRGLINTLDGRVSDTDMQSIMATLSVLKGAWTSNTEETKAISAWGEIKRLYTQKEKENLISEIDSIGTMTVSDVENLPEFNSKSLEEGMDTDSDDAKDLIKEAISRLESNESSLEANLSDITEEIIASAIDGSYMVKRDELETAEVKTKTVDKSEESSDILGSK